jgi:hypothetical protein
MDETGNQMGQSHQAELPDQPSGWIPAPHPIAPAFRQKRMNAVLDPAVEPMEEPSHIRLAIEVPPPPYDGIDPLDHLPQRQGCLPSREGSNLLLEPLHGLLPGDGVEVARVRPTSAPMGRQAKASALLHFVAEELEALADMDNPRLLRMQLDAQFLSEESLGDGQRPLGFFPRLTQHHEVVRPAREPEALLCHPAAD